MYMYMYVACLVSGVHGMHGQVHSNYQHAAHLFALAHSYHRGTSRSPLPIVPPVITHKFLHKLLGNGKQTHVPKFKSLKIVYTCTYMYTYLPANPEMV